LEIKRLGFGNYWKLWETRGSSLRMRKGNYTILCSTLILYCFAFDFKTNVWMDVEGFGLSNYKFYYKGL
jgi:hypothetical protein